MFIKETFLYLLLLATALQLLLLSTDDSELVDRLCGNSLRVISRCMKKGFRTKALNARKQKLCTEHLLTIDSCLKFCQRPFNGSDITSTATENTEVIQQRNMLAILENLTILQEKTQELFKFNKLKEQQYKKYEHGRSFLKPG